MLSKFRFIKIGSSRIWFIEIGSSKIWFIEIASLETVLRALSIFPKLNLQLAGAKGLCRACHHPMAVLDCYKSLQSVCLNHIFLALSAPLTHSRQFCTRLYLQLLLYAVVLPILTRIFRKTPKCLGSNECYCM